MRKKVGERQVPAKTEEVREDVCDICDQPTEHRGTYSCDEVTIERHHGSVYPDGDYTEKVWIDCCGKCFEEKIQPLIEQFLKKKFRECDIADSYGGPATCEPLEDL